MLVEWDQRTVDGLDLALNESTICGLYFDPVSGVARLLLEVVALPEVGPIDRDPRRVLLLAGTSRIDVTLRRMSQVTGAAITLDSLEDVEQFFASVTAPGQMHGWSFNDLADPGEDWDLTPGLSMTGGSVTGRHTLHWFSESGRPAPGGDYDFFILQGVVHFDDLSVERADGRLVTLDDFVADAHRWWSAMYAGDLRLSGDAQQRAQSTSLSWRTAAAPRAVRWVMVSAASSDSSQADTRRQK